MHEVSAIIKCLPLSHVNLSHSCIEPLTPNHLLTLKSQVNVSPPGEFVRQDLYLSKRWRRVQYLANIFLESLASRIFGLYQQKKKVDRSTTQHCCEWHCFDCGRKHSTQWVEPSARCWSHTLRRRTSSIGETTVGNNEAWLEGEAFNWFDIFESSCA